MHLQRSHVYRSVSHLVRSVYARLTSALDPVPLTILLSLIAVTAIAWAFTLHQSLSMGGALAPFDAAGTMAGGEMHGMDMQGMDMAGMMDTGWSVAGLAVFLVLWTVMMIAMMLPAAAPMVLMFAAVQARRERPVIVPAWIFVAGYVLIWGAVGLLVYILDQTIARVVGADVSLTRGTGAGTWAPLALGITLVLAGLYQLTPLKQVCLRHCRSPFGFVAQYWRDGRLGALGMGVRHGLYCLGCCWALFAVLIAVGMMSIAWMLSLTLVIFAEKVIPRGTRTSVAVGLGLIALGLLVAAGALPAASLV